MTGQRETTGDNGTDNGTETVVQGADLRGQRETTGTTGLSNSLHTHADMRAGTHTPVRAEPTGRFTVVPVVQRCLPWSEADNGKTTGESAVVRVLWTQRQIADALGVNYSRVSMWVKRGMLPEPVGSVIRPVGGGRRRAPLFDADEVLAWWKTYDPNERRGAHWLEKRERHRMVLDEGAE